MLRIYVILAIALTPVRAQGYGAIEDESAPPIPTNQQAISSLPQYYNSEPDAGAEAVQDSPPPPNSLQQEGGPEQGESSPGNYWWMNENAFGKPQGHPGVVPSDQVSPQVPQQKPPAPAPAPAPQRNPNTYSPQRPNAYQQNAPKPQRPQQPQPFKPQAAPPPLPQRPPQEKLGGWSGPGEAERYNPGSPSNILATPGQGNEFPPPIASPECQLLNKADCHQGQGPPHPPPPQLPPTNQYQPINLPPPQNYQPPSEPQGPPPSQPPQPQPYRSKQPAPPGSYQPPSSSPYTSAPLNTQSPGGSFQPPPSGQYENAGAPGVGNYQQQPQPHYDFGPPQSQQFPQISNAPAPQQQQGYRPQSQQSYSAPRPQNQQPRPRPQPQPSTPNYQQGQQPQYPNQNQYNAEPYRPQQQPTYQAPADDGFLPPGCPAAMLCVPDDQCNIIGTIEPGVQLTYSDKSHRVALSKCAQSGSGTEGVCCRDPNYKDPWPDMNGQGAQHQHHHHDKEQGQGNPQQQQQQQQQQQGFRNPYAGARGINGFKGGCAPNSNY